MQYICHTVRSGDSLQSIAASYGVNINNILAANPEIITQPVICPGVTITVPQPTITPPFHYPQPQPTPTPQQPTPQPTPGTGNGSGTISLEEQVVSLVNEERISRGLNPLALNPTLTDIARIKSDDMANNNFFSHNSPTYGSPFDMLRHFGVTFTTAGENIASGQTTAETVMNTWMNSAGHAANILNRSFTEIGVGYSYNNGRPIWTQLFIRP